MYHGTSWEKACEIDSNGFQISDEGRLGAGVYVARYEKARKFALAKYRHGGESCGMLEVIISFRYPKYASCEDDDWQDQGHDACRADETAVSTASMVKVPLRATPLGPTRSLAAWMPERGRANSLVPAQDRRFHCLRPSRYQHGVVCQVR